MTAVPIATPARVRGAAAVALTAVLPPAAHAAAGGRLPSSATASLLMVLAVTLGALVASLRSATGFGVLAGLLGVAGHSHPSAGGAPWGLMLAAHVVGGRLCAAMSRVLRASSPPPRRPIASRPLTVVHSADQPRQSALRLADSVSHRGPPVGVAH